MTAPSTTEELISFIERGLAVEHRLPNLELKSSWSQDYGKKLSSLSNRITRMSGWLVVGIDDDGNCLGKDESWAQQEERKIANHVNQYLDPTQACLGITVHEVNSSWVIAVRVANPGTVVRWNGKAYKGAGTAKDEMNQSEVLGLQVSLPGLEDYSAQPTEDREINVKLVHAFASSLGHRADEPGFASLDIGPTQILEAARISDRRVTSLLFGEARWRIVEFDAYGGVVRNVQRKGLYGILTPSTNRELRLQGGLVDVYPEKALREALGNAVAHAAYFQSNGDIIIEIHPDHITISNLCLPGSVHFANKWFSRSHNTVNPLLMETLRLAGHVDEVGRGKSVMMKELLQRGHPPPRVISESAGQYQRWKCLFYRRNHEDRDIRLFERLKTGFHDERKALLATALVHWRNEPLSAIRQYVDDESRELFASVMSDTAGPIVPKLEEDKIQLRRWVEVLMGHGQDSKTLDPAEEEAVKEQVYRRSINNPSKTFALSDIRELAGMGSTNAERVLSSALAKKWCSAGEVTKRSHGKYVFVRNPATRGEAELFSRLLESLVDTYTASPFIFPLKFPG